MTIIQYNRVRHLKSENLLELRSRNRDFPIETIWKRFNLRKLLDEISTAPMCEYPEASPCRSCFCTEGQLRKPDPLFLMGLPYRTRWISSIGSGSKYQRLLYLRREYFVGEPS